MINQMTCSSILFLHPKMILSPPLSSGDRTLGSRVRWSIKWHTVPISFFHPKTISSPSLSFETTDRNLQISLVTVSHRCGLWSRQNSRVSFQVFSFQKGVSVPVWLHWFWYLFQIHFLMVVTGNTKRIRKGIYTRCINPWGKGHPVQVGGKSGHDLVFNHMLLWRNITRDQSTHSLDRERNLDS